MDIEGYKKYLEKIGFASNGISSYITSLNQTLNILKNINEYIDLNDNEKIIKFSNAEKSFKKEFDKNHDFAHQKTFNNLRSGARRYKYYLQYLKLNEILEEYKKDKSKFITNDAVIYFKIFNDDTLYPTKAICKEIVNDLELINSFTTDQARSKLNKIYNAQNSSKKNIIFIDINSNEIEEIRDENIEKYNLLKNETENFTNTPLDEDWKFSHLNLLLKGVPGTGKSHTLETIIENDLNLKNKPKNICHINIHSASSNADLMQGIGINSNGGQIEYKEKQGLIYNHIKKALFTPNQPFVLILEEIQENSLNELIGDLIYLIEEKKRVTVDSTKFEDGEEYEYQEFIEKVLEDENNKHSIQIPYLVDTSTDYRKMVLPSNLYIFCTSNYRDDKKVIEDNLLRRFDVVEVYPKYEGIFESTDIPQFLKILNQEFLKQFDQEMHPDRYLVGHANWLYITNEDSEKNKKRFYTALLKVIIELKEIREIDFKNYTKKILEKVLQDTSLSYRIKEYIEACNFEYKSYKEMVEKLQSKIYPFL